MVDTNTLAIGAYWNDGNGNNSGHVRVYEFGGITSLPESKLQSKLFIHPNPTDGLISIELDEYSNLPLQILDLSGKVVQEFNLNTTQTNLDLTELAEGIYFARYGEVTKKLVITR